MRKKLVGKLGRRDHLEYLGVDGKVRLRSTIRTAIYEHYGSLIATGTSP
jgi:hypothetical protein